jgi:hypothetical protein
MSIVLNDLLRTKALEAMDLDAYVQLFEQVVAEGRTTGPVQTDDYIAYTKLNLARWRRVGKTMELLPEALDVLRASKPLTWLIISEPWCGDAAQVLPVLATMAAHIPGADVRIVLRDEHPELMDRYLTNGGRSIPKLIAFDRSTGTERFSWGPRPLEAQELVLELRARHQGDWKAAAEELHRWYHADATRSTQREILALLRG